MVTRYFPGQGHRYDERGWPRWERAVAELVIDALFDLDKRSAMDRESFLLAVNGDNKILSASNA